MTLRAMKRGHCAGWLDGHSPGWLKYRNYLPSHAGGLYRDACTSAPDGSSALYNQAPNLRNGPVCANAEDSKYHCTRDHEPRCCLPQTPSPALTPAGWRRGMASLGDYWHGLAGLSASPRLTWLAAHTLTPLHDAPCRALASTRSKPYPFGRSSLGISALHAHGDD
jgi:hypothetical protein